MKKFCQKVSSGVIFSLWSVCFCYIILIKESFFVYFLYCIRLEVSKSYMGFLDFDIKEPVHLNWTGKFIAPDENWVHISRALTDFELIVMTEGGLYIADTEGECVLPATSTVTNPPSAPFTGHIFPITILKIM